MQTVDICLSYEGNGHLNILVKAQAKEKKKTHGYEKQTEIMKVMKRKTNLSRTFCDLDRLYQQLCY